MTQDASKTTEPYVGKELGSVSFTVTEDALGDYYDGLNLSRPQTAPVPSMIASGPDNAYFAQSSFSNHFGHLWMRQEWELFAPLTPGRTYTATAQITDIYPKRNRSVVRYEVELRTDSGELALRSQHHQSYLLDQQDGQLVFRDPKAKQGARRFVVPEGEPFEPLERIITLEMCDRFFHGDANYHTNREESKKLGFGDVVIGGRMTMAYAAHILEERFGAAWWTSGRLDTKFTNPVWPNETVIARGVMTGPLEEEPERTGAFVWLAKPDETVVLPGHNDISTILNERRYNPFVGEGSRIDFSQFQKG